MAEINDGGPAFPGYVVQEDGSRQWHPGMSMRDWFAGQLLAGAIANEDIRRAVIKMAKKDLPEADEDQIDQRIMEILAVSAYMQADVMLDVREWENVSPLDVEVETDKA